jgi:hypothetical protein
VHVIAILLISNPYLCNDFSGELQLIRNVRCNFNDFEHVVAIIHK